MSAKNSTEKHEKITKIKIEFKKVVDMDRFHNDKAPLFKARVADFRRSIFEPAKLIPPNLPVNDEMIASGEVACLGLWFFFRILVLFFKSYYNVKILITIIVIYNNNG